MFYFQQTLWVIGVFLAAVLLVKLAYTGLYRFYFWFSAYLGLEVVRSLILFAVGPKSDAYETIFLVTHPLSWLLSIMVVLELYSLALGNLPGIASLSRWVMSGSMAAAVALSALSLSADLSRQAGSPRILALYSVIERGLVFSLVLFLLLISIFLMWYPISIRRNVVVHATLYSIHFLSVSFFTFIRNLVGSRVTTQVSIVLVFVDCVCFTLWIAWLSREGEETKVVVRSKWLPEDQDRLLRQLDSLSDALRRGRR